MKKRILAASLAMLLLFASCGGEDVGENASKETTQAPITTTAPETTAPPADFGDYDFTVLTSYSDGDAAHSIFEDERNSAVINEKIAERNAAVEALLNVKIAEYSSADPLSELSKDNLLTSGAFDAVVVSASNSASLLSSALLVDLNTLEEFDPEATYFDKAAIRDLSLGGKIFTVTGDLINSSVGATSVVLCNTSLLSKLDIKKELGASLPELVEKGEWTLDAMTRASALAVSRDEDEAPLYRGFFGDTSSAYQLSVGLFGTVFEKDEHDIPLLNVTEEGFVDLLKKVASLSLEEEKTEFSALFGSCYNLEPKAGEALFAVSTLEEAATLTREGLCFSVLPMPKDSPEQVYYASRVDLDNTCLAAIPASTSNAARSVAVLSALCEKAGDTSMAAYLTRFEKNCNHPGFEIMPTILDSRKYDLGDLFGWGDFESLICESINDPELETSFPEAAGIRGLAAEKAMDIVLKRLLGENYKEETR